MEYSFTITQPGELHEDATEMGLSFDVSASGELFSLLLVVFLEISDVSGELDATEMGLSFDVSV